MRSRWMIALALLLPAALPVAAGSTHKKCPETTQECLDKMASRMRNSGWVGLELDIDGPEWKVLRIVPGSPAEAVGIQAGDVLIALNGVRLSSANEETISKAKKDWRPGQAVTYTIRRSGVERDVTLTLAAWPADVLAKWIGEHMLEHVSADMAAAKPK